MHEFFTQFAYFQPAGESGWLSLGNVWTSRDATDRARALYKTSRSGFRQITDEQVTVETPSNEFTLSEKDEFILQVLFHANASALVSQLSGVGTVVSLSAIVHNRFFDLGKTNISNLVVRVGGVPKTSGTDYLVMLSSGMILFLASGSIASGATVDCTFDHAVLSSQQHVAWEKIYRAGTAKVYSYGKENNPLILLWDEFPSVIRAVDPGQRNEELHTIKFNLLRLDPCTSYVPAVIINGNVISAIYGPGGLIIGDALVMDLSWSQVIDECEYPAGPVAWNGVNQGIGWRTRGQILDRGAAPNDDCEYAAGEVPSANEGELWLAPAQNIPPRQAWDECEYPSGGVAHVNEGYLFAATAQVIAF
jgi:hypothetical protein